MHRRVSSHVLTLIVGGLLGALLIAPAAGHVTKSFSHLWGDHIKPKIGRQVVTDQKTANGENTTSFEVTCPGAKHPTGGGVDARQDDGSYGVRVRVIESFPTENGWHVSVRNDDPGDKLIRAYAVCMNL